MKKILSSIVLLFVAAALHAEVNFVNQPEWKDVLAKAKAESKFIFVDAYTDWCVWCKVMDKNTFPEQEVSDLLNNKFIPVKMEMETGYGTVLAMKYHVSNFPTFLIFNSDGQLVDKLLGYQKTKEFMANLDKSIHNAPMKGFSKEVELAYPDFYKKSFVKNELGKKERPDSSVVQSYLAAQKDLTTEINWSVVSQFSRMTRKYDQIVLDNSSKLRGLYGKVEVDRYITSIVNAGLGNAIENKDEVMLHYKVFQMIDKYLPEDASQLKTDYEISFYTQTDNFTKMMAALTDLVKKNGYTDYASTLNGACWGIYEKCTDEQIVNQAIAHMKQVVDKEPEYAYLDTYAALLYKGKQVAEAEKYAQMAIDEGRKSKQNTKETEELLAKMKAETSK